MEFPVLSILRSGTPSQVHEPVVFFVPVQVSTLVATGTRSDEGAEDEAMDGADIGNEQVPSAQAGMNDSSVGLVANASH